MIDSFRVQLQTALGAAYTLDRELSGGGMSRVFVVHDESLGRDVVVKVLAPDLAAGLSAERFAREIKLAASLQEPHIVPVLAAGVMADGLPWYTMPFVRGESLRARLERGPVPLAETVAILRNVAHAYGQGVVHRDIKPENMLLNEGTAVVTDFGIAKALSAFRTQAPAGTLTVVGTRWGRPRSRRRCRYRWRAARPRSRAWSGPPRSSSSWARPGRLDLGLTQVGKSR